LIGFSGTSSLFLQSSRKKGDRMLDHQNDQPQVYKFCDEAVLMLGLLEDTFTLIKRTKGTAPIKKLLEIHDILNTNFLILQKFQMTFDEVWIDVGTLRYLNHLRCELFVYHRSDFESPREFDTYSRLLARFINLVILRLKNGFGIDDIEPIVG